MRLQHYYQFQAILKPSPTDILERYLGSLEAIGIDTSLHDIRFVEDDWESPTLGAWGLGWEVWCDGSEVSQFTYFQQVGGIEVDLVSGEITYGLERLAMYLFDKKTIYDLPFNRTDSEVPLTYGDVFLQNEQEQSAYNFERRRHRDAVPPLRRRREGVRPADRAQAAAAGLRAVHKGLALLQPARRARRDQRHRAAELHPARARPRQGVLRGVARPTQTARGGAEMAELLLELLSEEIPARMQARAAEDLKRLVGDGLKAAGLAFTDARAFATPRRLALVVDGLPTARADVSEERRGPRVGAPDQAVQGFLKGAGLASLDQAEKRDTGKGEFWFAVHRRRRAGRPPRRCPASSTRR